MVVVGSAITWPLISPRFDCSRFDCDSDAGHPLESPTTTRCGSHRVFHCASAETYSAVRMDLASGNRIGIPLRALEVSMFVRFITETSTENPFYMPGPFAAGRDDQFRKLLDPHDVAWHEELI